MASPRSHDELSGGLRSLDLRATAQCATREPSVNQPFARGY